MKFATRFFAILLCFTLCIIPLPFSVSAADITEDNLIAEISEHGLLGARGEVLRCSCGGIYNVIEYGGNFTDTIVGSSSECFKRLYPAVRIECVECGNLSTAYNVYRSFSHVNMVSRVENGVTIWYCPKCGYQQS